MNIFFSVLRLSDLRRDLQAKIGTMNVNINIGPAVENYGGETFLSQEVAINILQETKLAFKRCQSVSLNISLSVSLCTCQPLNLCTCLSATLYFIVVCKSAFISVYKSL